MYLTEANYIGAHTIEDNVFIGGRAATHSSRDAVWWHNLLADVAS